MTRKTTIQIEPYEGTWYGVTHWLVMELGESGKVVRTQVAEGKGAARELAILWRGQIENI